MFSMNDGRSRHNVLDRALAGMFRTMGSTTWVRPFAFLTGAALALGTISGLPSYAGEHTSRPSAVAVGVADGVGGDEGDFMPIPPRSFTDRVESIANWVIDNSSYAGYRRLPSFAVVPRKTLNYIFYDRTGRGYEGQGNILALYLPNLILLSDAFDLDRHQETMVRELVRHLQYESGGSFDCPKQADREAYETQIKWVEEAGKGSRPGPIFMQKLTCNTPRL